MELEQSATKTIAIKMFDIIHDGKQKEKLRTNQFFSSLLEPPAAREHAS
jgi:hypothetical protein